MIKDFRYIYNIKQANFYIQNGLVPLEVGVLNSNVFCKFKDSEELQNTFNEWMQRKNN